MRSYTKFSALALASILGLSLCQGLATYAEGEQVDQASLEAATSISISPVSKFLQLEANNVYEDVFKVSNAGSQPLKFEVHVSPYAFTQEEEGEDYKLGFNRETAYTQMTRWITFKDANGNYVANPKFTAEPGASVEIAYRISTPASIPAGGQYAVLFAHTLSDSNAGGIKTEASPGLIIYGRSVGDTITSGEIRDLKLSQSKEVVENQDGKQVKVEKNLVNASAKVKNTGNVDFMAVGTLKVEGIFGRSYYETPTTKGRVSIIPDTELAVSDTWDETPYFGIFKATWTVTAAGQTEEISQVIFLLPLPILVLMLLLLTIVIVWIIIMVRKRKERRSKFAVQKGKCEKTLYKTKINIKHKQECRV